MDPSKKKSHKQIKKAMAAKQKHGLEDDERFAHAATDPTFRGGRKKRKLKIDPRFKGALDDERFGLAQGKVDKRGRKVDKNAQAESLAPFYELDDGLTAPERARRAELDAKMRGEDDDGASSSSDEETPAYAIARARRGVSPARMKVSRSAMRVARSAMRVMPPPSEASLESAIVKINLRARETRGRLGSENGPCVLDGGAPREPQAARAAVDPAHDATEGARVGGAS